MNRLASITDELLDAIHDRTPDAPVLNPSYDLTDDLAARRELAAKNHEFFARRLAMKGKG